MTELDELQTKIELHTGRRPTATGLRYLRRKLAELEQKVRSGEHIRRFDDPAVQLSITLPRSVRDQLSKVAPNVSGAIGEALTLWARAKRHRALARACEGE